MKALLLALLSGALCLSPGARAQGNPVYIGLDAEFGEPTGIAAEAIRRGMLIAIEEINQGGGVLNGRTLALLERDNRAVAARSIENIKELAFLRAQNCDEAQGYYFSKPVTAEKFLELLEEERAAVGGGVSWIERAANR